MPRKFLVVSKKRFADLAVPMYQIALHFSKDEPQNETRT